MKYLWVEDFNGNTSFDMDYDRWKKYFSLEEKDIILCKTLESALIQMTEHPNSFDVVMLDISLVNEFNDKLYPPEKWEELY